MSSRMRATRGHTRNRRSHHGLKSPRLSACPECSSVTLRHRMCEECGTYRGKQVVNMKEVREREAARVLRKRRRMGLEDEAEKSTSDSE